MTGFLRSLFPRTALGYIRLPGAGPLPSDSDLPLLPTNGTSEDSTDVLELNVTGKKSRKRPRHWAFMFLFLAILPFFFFFPWRRKTPRNEYANSVDHSPENYARLRIDDLYSRQSSTLERAISRYTLKTKRKPPLHFDRWYQYARDHSCLIDEYDQIHNDFAPFYDLAARDPAFFQKMVTSVTAMVKTSKMGMATAQVRDGVFSFTDVNNDAIYYEGWNMTIEPFASLLPNLNIIFNGRDEPRVLFNYRVPDVIEQALDASDDQPFHHKPERTSIVYKDQKKCLVPNRPNGFTSFANDASAFLISSTSSDYATDLYPILSASRVSPCFADILLPSQYYNSKSPWAANYAYPNNVTWENKQNKLYWRGGSTGGIIHGTDYHRFPRFRLLDIGRDHTDIMDVKISKFLADEYCGDDCDAEVIRNEYHIIDMTAPREAVYDFKYLLDIDGNGFSGRYLGLMRSGSLVFKSTVFSEFFDHLLQPFIHYLPVLPDLSDLVSQIEWANSNQAEARRIQETGRQFAQRVLTDAQNECYLMLVLLEWARLQSYAEARSAT
ncbi:glycosyl transferase family 90-domain-containing protein [Mycena floridula]|nr:glycosyl transferase family 90-domain-containing protein [Mycena floridula]